MQTSHHTIPVEWGTIGAYYVRPEGDGPFPAVVVIHEAYGLNENIKDITRRFAEVGYAALGVDLFAGRSQVICMARFFSGIFLNSLDHEGIRDLKAALTYLTKQPEIDAERIGAIGFCMGGSFAVAWASTDSRLKVIAPFYASNPRPLNAAARSCPVVGSYPENDFTANPGRNLKTLLDASGIENDIKVYPNAKHSFFNNQSGNYNPAASEDAWQRTLAFFTQKLGTA